MNDRASGLKILFNVLTVCLCFVLIVSVIRVAFDFNPISFSGFLDYVSKTPSIDISYYTYLSIGGDWGVIDGLRVFLNYIMVIINVLLWLCKNVANLMLFVVYYVRFLFV